MGLKNGLLISHVILIENGRFYFDLVPKTLGLKLYKLREKGNLPSSFFQKKFGFVV